jgi:TP901 family phage tail tape measure protein
LATNLALQIIIGATDQASPVVGKLAKNMTGALDSTNPVAGAVVASMTAITGAAIGMGAASVKAAADFQQTMLQSQALANVSAADARVASAEIMKMAVATGQSPQKLAEGFYYVASAGYSARDSLTLLGLAARSAAVGNTQTEVTANALTAILSTYGMKASEAARVTDQMVASVSMGKTEFKDYAQVIGVVAVNAKQSGVSFGEATSAFSALTNVMASSKQAKDALDALLQTSSRFDVLDKRAKSLGLTFDENAYKSMNFEQRLKYLQQITGGNTQEITKLLGRQNAMAAMTVLSANNFDMYNKSLKSVVGSHGALDAAFAKTSQGFNATMGRAKASLDVLMITVGTALLPVLTQLMDQVAPLITQFTQWLVSSGALKNGIAFVAAALQNLITTAVAVVTFFQHNQEAFQALTLAAIALAGAIGGILVFALLSAAAATWAAITPMLPFIAAGAAVALVIAGIVVAVQRWTEISAYLTDKWSGVTGFFSDLWSNVVTTFDDAESSIGNTIQAVVAWFDSIKIPVEVVAGIITTFFAPALIKAGVEASIAGGKIAFDFVSAMITTGTQATVNGALTSATFIKSMITSGIEATKNAAIVTSTFVWSMIVTAGQAIQTGAMITYNFIASLIKTGVEGWIAAGKLAVYVGSLIASGAQATIAGAAVAGRFVLAVITSGTEAVVAGSKLAISFVGGMISAATESGAAAAILTTTIIPALYATGAAAYAAAGPLGILAATVTGVVGVVKYEIENMKGNVITNYNEQRSKVTQMSSSMAKDTTANTKTMADNAVQQTDSMKIKVSKSVEDLHANMTKQLQGITSDSYNAFYQMQYSGQVNLDKLQKDVGAAFAKIDGKDNKGKLNDIGDAAKALFDSMRITAQSDLSQIDSSAQSYLQSILDYVKQAQKALADLNAWNAGKTAEQTIQSQHGTGGIYNKNAYAEGTDFAAGGMALVGERGPEVMFVPRGSQVIPNHRTQLLLGSLAMMSHAIPLARSSSSLVSHGGNTHYNTIVVNAPARTQDEADEIAETVAKKLGTMLQGQSTLPGGLR